jgi:hypothetical protein
MKIADDDTKHEFILKFNEGGGDIMDEYIELIDMSLDGKSIFGQLLKEIREKGEIINPLIQFGDTKYSEYYINPGIELFNSKYNHIIFDWRGLYVQLGYNENHTHEMTFIDNREHPESFSKEDNDYYIIKAVVTNKHKVFANDYTR